MKYLLSRISLALLVMFIVGAVAADDGIELGDKAPMLDQPVQDVSGKMLTLQDVAGENGLLVIFSCNTCPWVSKWEDRYNPIADQAKQAGIGTIALNPNERIRDRGESLEDMKARAQKQNYDFYYALDKDHKIADAFGASRTPHVFLFDKDMTLVYMGAIDDNANSAENVEEPYLSNAIEALVNGQPISTSSTRSLGCTIKRTR